jgi:hypothetical protein
MVNPEQHEMQFRTSYPGGAEEWYCPTCGRRTLMQWPPNYKKVVLDPGDENAAHSLSKGGLGVGKLQVNRDEQTDASDEPDLSRWEAWLADVDLGDSGPQ